MKNKKILVTLSFIFIFLISTGCGKKMITSKQFINVLSDNGYEILDQTPWLEMAELDKINNYIIASSEEKKMKISYIETINDNASKSDFDDLLMAFEQDKNVTITKEKHKKNYEILRAKDSNYYYRAIRYKRITIYGFIKLGSENELDAIFSKLGY